MKYGLSDAVVEKLCGVLAQFPEVERAVLYGSRAQGNYKVGSDIDLSVFAELDNADLREHIERVGLASLRTLAATTDHLAQEADPRRPSDGSRFLTKRDLGVS
jgi:predicted nucleotidyltransferase